MSKRLLTFSLLLSLAPLQFVPRAAAQQVTARAQGNRARLAQLNAEVQEHLRMQQPALAIAGLREIVKLDPSNAEAHGNLGVLLYFQHDYSGAARELRVSTKLHPGIPRIEALLGLAEDRAGEVAVGRLDMERAYPKITEENIQSEVGLALAASYSRTGEQEKAVAALSTLLGSQPSNRIALYRAYRIYADLADRSLLTLGMTSPGSAEMFVSMGRELARHHDDEAAIANYRQAIAIAPNFPGVHMELGRLLFSSSSDAIRKQATPEFEAAVAADANDQQAHLMLGVAEERAGNAAAAREHFTRAVELAPNDSDACTELAKILIGDGDRGKAQLLLERAISSDPTNYVAHYRLSTIYRQAGNKDAARAEADAYLKYKKLSDRLQKFFDTLRLGAFERKDESDLQPVK
jgi:cytochrome c-type biogenesis protein CcmH/NrfG